ncbi:hypothetical protein IW150_000611 [Coemansia sp. RSA 2607]|nr:hypothetical protein IW150_000611 [Coemansia sp. RSA 2607]
MLQQQAHEGDRVGGSAGRTGVGARQAVEPVVEPKEARAAMESAVGTSGLASIATEKARLDDECMAKMEKRMDGICTFLHDLMVVQQEEQYYAESKATPTLMRSGRQFPQQEKLLFSMPNARLQEHTYLGGNMRDKPVSSPGSKLAAKESTYYLTQRKNCKTEENMTSCF